MQNEGDNACHMVAFSNVSWMHFLNLTSVLTWHEDFFSFPFSFLMQINRNVQFTLNKFEWVGNFSAGLKFLSVSTLFDRALEFPNSKNFPQISTYWTCAWRLVQLNWPWGLLGSGAALVGWYLNFQRVSCCFSSFPGGIKGFNWMWNIRQRLEGRFIDNESQLSESSFWNQLPS